MYTYLVSVGRPGSALVHALSPEDARTQFGAPDWSLRSLQKQEDLGKNFFVGSALCMALHGTRARRAFAPNVALASAAIANNVEMKDRIRLWNIDLYRNKDLPADGVTLDPGEAFVMSAGGCPVIIASGGGSMVVAHAARDSLIDRKAVGGTPGREHISVVRSIVAALKKRGVRPGEVTMCMLFSIPVETFGHSFDHPEYGAYNRALETFINERWPDCTTRGNGGMFLDLERLFVEQARQEKVQGAWAMLSLRECPALAHTRDGKGRERRNLIIVKRDE